MSIPRKARTQAPGPEGGRRPRQAGVPHSPECCRPRWNADSRDARVRGEEARRVGGHQDLVEEGGDSRPEIGPVHSINPQVPMRRSDPWPKPLER
jgi:hypothetical protein